MPKLWLENSSPEFETAAREYFELGQKDADVGVIFLSKSLAIDIKNSCLLYTSDAADEV